jgi:maleate cis-trans isomerase
MTKSELRLGVIYPVGGADHEYYRFAERAGTPMRVFLVTTRLMGDETDHSVEALMRTGRTDYLENAAARLATLVPDVALWACTSASFVVGRAGAEDQVKAISARAGCPAGSTSLAFVNALAALGARRVAIMATYPEEVARRFESFLGEFGVSVSDLHWLGAPSGYDAGLIPPAEVCRAVRDADHAEADAVLIPDTALPTLDLIEDLEAELGKPVLTANQVTLWEGLRLAGRRVGTPGMGRLLAA